MVGLKKFVKCDDVPEFPRYKSEEEHQRLIKEYINSGAIPKKDLISGEWYIGQSRSTNIAQWFSAIGFNFIRHKLGGSFVDTIEHFEDDTQYDVFVPIKRIEL